MEDAVLYDVDNGVASLVFNTPDNLNAMSRRLGQGFSAGVRRALDDPGVRVLTLTGNGRAFCAGADLSDADTHSANDLAGFLGMRLSEHAVHTWDVAVALDPNARIAPESVGLLAVRLPTMAPFMGKKQEEASVVEVSTTDPAVTFTLDTGGVALTPGSTGATASLALPAEAFVRLVYGRLNDDADVTSAAGVTVAELQAVFPGF